jgi:hypothetical protein
MSAELPRRASVLSLAMLCAAALAGCADTLQDQPIAHNILEGMLVAPYPVYWLGGSFDGHAITEATKDPGGAYRLQYGNCVQGGQSTCTPAVRVVTSPDNSFIPEGELPPRTAALRGVLAQVTESGRTIEVATGGVVVSIHSPSATLASGAAQTIVPINQPGAPFAPLPARLRDSGFGETPLPAQLPSPLHTPPGPQLLH